MILRSAARTDVGLRRRANEDRYAIAASLGLYLVADGMGGHTAGQVASDLAAQSAVRALETLEGMASGVGVIIWRGLRTTGPGPSTIATWR